MNTTAEATVHIFGVRHLSPAGAKHLLDVMEQVRPTAVLIEGPQDASPEIRHLTNPNTKPPVAILAFTDELPVRTAMWPFAVYSPEYQAMLWAAGNGAHCAFIDLPTSAVLALQSVRSEDVPDLVEEAERENDRHSPDVPALEADLPNEGLNEQEASIYQRIAALAGEQDYDMYWERHYEHNMSPGAYQQAILAFSEQMRALTEPMESSLKRTEYAYNAVREAYMLRQIQETIAAGHQPDKIVVVCGAYHAAALANGLNAMSDDELAALPTRSSKLTLMPYSYYRLSSMSGYGAGNNAPHYYELMWEHITAGTLDQLPEHYLSRAARLLREAGTHRSTAEVIEAVRLAQSLAALHNGSAPTLLDLRDAAKTLLGQGELGAVAEALARLDVGTAIGLLAEGVSQTPIQDDLNRFLRQLKLEKYKTTVAADLALDLRENRRVKSEEARFLDLKRSTLFHRLQLLGISLAKYRGSGQEQATWAEHWVIQWTPEVEIEVVESTLLGETIEVACAFVLQQKLQECTSIDEAAKLIRTACECALLTQMDAARQVLQHIAADSQDVVQMGAAAHELSMIIRYGDVRRMDTTPLEPLLAQLFLRASLFLLDASSCNDEASAAMLSAINQLNSIALDHQEQVEDELWIQQLTELARRDDRNPRLSGFACAILLERNILSASQCAEEVSRRLSPGIPADIGAGWFEGLSMRNRYALLSRMSLWEQLNAYIESLDDEEFRRALVFLRRSFSTFNPSEKVMIAEILGELWGIEPEEVEEALGGELKEDEADMLEQLNDFDFEDF
ncbi:DUF5682 family protein [Paenibacillus aquistagni]|uniref:Uncharacterized protein n=1 Tax=Paenibacillus aquistagni TaxID=1852522 RepID=A0A1X7IVX0_9BACL|nr:DUF5682 family protein [Paenibacillus aquistagni]SMG19233.1 hypothetical protein SAMN06295960_0888 [Paenibacillus aquistagni]